MELAETPDGWLSNKLYDTWGILNYVYRQPGTYHKLQELEYHFGLAFNFNDDQLSEKGLPPIPAEERAEILETFYEFFMRDRIYTMRRRLNSSR